MPYVYCLTTCAVKYDGRVLHLTKGIPWRDDDPFVQARPEMFSRKPPVTGATVEDSAPVERATQAPGERRRVRRG